MNANQMEELAGLLQVQSSDVDGLLEPLEVSLPGDGNCPAIPISFYYVRFQDENPRFGHLIEKLSDCVVPYCISRRKLNTLDAMKVRTFYMEAKKLFATPTTGRSGEPGEVLAYFMLEGKFRATKIISKMRLKTNRNVHIHGADGVHLKFEGSAAFLYFAESKLYKDYDSAIRDAIDSVKDFLSNSEEEPESSQDFEIDVVTEHLDLLEGELRDQVLKILDPYSAERSSLVCVHACFIGFDMVELGGKCSEQRFADQYKAQAIKCYNYVHSAIRREEKLANERWIFVFIPFHSVDTFRKTFLDGLKT